jgi:Xaa-Pro aminopeptidase
MSRDDAGETPESRVEPVGGGVREYDRTAAFDVDVRRFRHDYPEFDYETRLAEFADRLADTPADAAVLTHFVDCTYYAGSGQPINLYVPAGDPGGARAFVRRAMGFARQEIGLDADRVVSGGLSALADHADGVETLGVTLDAMPASLADRLAGALDADPVGVSDQVLAQRAVKDDGEVALLERAAGCYAVARDAIEAAAAPGVTEREVAAAVADALVEAGVTDRVFFRRWDARLPAAGLVAAGDTLPLVSGHAMTVTGVGTGRSMPWGASNNALDEGDFLVADLALNYAGYHGDIARTFVVGDASDDQREWFEATREIHRAARDAIEPGVAASVPYEAARERAESLGVADWLCGYAEMQAPYVGHSIGLEGDEEPTLMAGNDAEIREGMVLTVEPKLMHPDRGAAMLEDDYVVTGDRVRRLSPVPMELFEVPVEG